MGENSSLPHTVEGQRPTKQGDTGPIDSEPKLLQTVEQVARRLSVGRSTAYSLVLSGQLESVTVGRLRRVPVEALATFLGHEPGNVIIYGDPTLIVMVVAWDFIGAPGSVQFQDIGMACLKSSE